MSVGREYGGSMFVGIAGGTTRKNFNKRVTDNYDRGHCFAPDRKRSNGRLRVSSGFTPNAIYRTSNARAAFIRINRIQVAPFTCASVYSLHRRDRRNTFVKLRESPSMNT